MPEPNEVSVKEKVLIALGCGFVLGMAVMNLISDVIHEVIK